MNNISFKATLKIDPDFYKNIPKGVSKDYPKSLISELTEFINLRGVKEALEGDIIEIKREKVTYGDSLDMKFISDKLSEPFVANIAEPQIKPKDLRLWTLVFLCKKNNEKQRFGETVFGMVKRIFPNIFI